MAVSSSDFKFSTTGIHQSSLSPKYLHTNSTSHTWPFSAIAELIDNSYDPDVKASQLWIGEARINSKICLTFTDNGNGMQRDKLYKMLSFGFCEKVADGTHMPVGHYGNGFKSGSMRLGKDALVLTKQRYTRSIGYLSQTYLEAIKAETVVVPIATWDHTDLDDYNLHANSVEALRTIYEHSLIKTEKELNYEFDQIDGEHGTRIIISNIRTTADNQPEFDFVTDQYDIRIPDDTSPEGEKYRKTNRQNHVPECDYSLRAYCAILYLKPKMQIFVRQKKVKTLVVERSLSNTEVDRYRPTCAASDPVKVVFGFNSQNKNHYGIMMYHRNRLIKPYERVGYQLKANNLGVGVVGVVQCDFLQPTHNKQDFDYTKAYRACINALGQKLNEYWNEKKGPVKTNFVEPSFPEPQEVKALPDQTWVQCDKPSCLKWRKLPDGIDPKTLPDKWYCHMNPDPNFKSCDAPEEKEEENVVPYEKKQKKRLIKEMEAKQKREQATKKEQDEKIRNILAKEEMLKKREEQLTLRESGNITSPKIKIEGSANSTLVTSQKSSSSVASNSKLLNGHSALRTPTNSQSSPRTPAKVQPTSFANLTPLTRPRLATNQLTPASQSSGFVVSALKSSTSNRLGVASSSPTQKVTLLKTNTGVTKMNSAKLPCRIIKTNGETFILQGTQSIGGSLKLGVTTSSVNDVKPSTTASVFTAPVKILPKNGTTANATMTTPNTVRTVTIPSVLTKQPTTANATMTTPNTVSAPILNKDVKPSPLRLAAVAYSGITGNKSTTPEDVRNVVLPGIKRGPSENLLSAISAKIQRKNSSPGVIIIDPTPVQSSDSMQQKPLKVSVSADVRVQELEKKVSELQTELAKCNKDAAMKTKNLNFLLEAKSVQIQHKDKEIVEKKTALKVMENILSKRTKQLKVLRDNVCKLLQVLVPEIDVESEGHDEGIDDLLKQVLEANK